MMPFPEVELVTIERLEVALRNKNMKLLKEGTYKLHEKYHSGYQFEHLDKLKTILADVINNSSVPNDIKDILCPTIQDILSESGMGTDINSPHEALNQNRVSSLTQLSYNTSNTTQTTLALNEAEAPIDKISAFDVFSAPKNENSNYAQSPFETENKPFQEFKMPEIQPETTANSVEDISDMSASKSSPAQFDIPEEVRQESVFKIEQNTESMSTPQGFDTVPVFEKDIAAPQKLKEIAIFYCQDTSSEKVKNILRYRELISKLQDEHHSINEILHLISEINVQSNTNIIELKNILDQIQINNHKVNLITNSTSANLIGLMEKGDYSYSLYERSEDKQINLVPVFGLSNQFICSICSETYLDKEEQINPLVLQCPKCKSPMFPNYYTANNHDIQMNLDYYNNALMALASSTVWVVIHPIAEDKVMTNLILSALKLNPSIEDIYILDKDINTREDFKKRFIELKDTVNVNIHMSALEDFLNSIG